MTNDRKTLTRVKHRHRRVRKNVDSVGMYRRDIDSNYVMKLNLLDKNQETGTGTLTSAEGYDTPVDGEVVYGADWLLNEPDNEHAIPNLKLLIK